MISRGYGVLVPWGVNQRYDLLIEQDGKFLRAQCKTGRLRHGAIRFATKSVRMKTRKAFWRGYVGEADLFLVHCPQTGGVYVVPVDEAPTQEMRLRVEPSRNNQARGIHWAKDYELPA